MDNTIKYKDYIGSVEFSETDGNFYGKVQGICSLISYEGKSIAELVTDFHDAVDSYLESCKANGDTPETAFKDSVNISSDIKNCAKMEIGKSTNIDAKNDTALTSLGRRGLRGEVFLESYYSKPYSEIGIIKTEDVDTGAVVGEEVW